MILQLSISHAIFEPNSTEVTSSYAILHIIIQKHNFGDSCPLRSVHFALVCLNINMNTQRFAEYVQRLTPIRSVLIVQSWSMALLVVGYRLNFNEPGSRRVRCVVDPHCTTDQSGVRGLSLDSAAGAEVLSLFMVSLVSIPRALSSTALT